MKIPASLVLILLCYFVAQSQQNTYTKPQAINYIKSYYANFKTGSYEVATKGEAKKYRQYTGNYKVSIEGCKFKISYDEISWPNDCTTTIDYEVYNWDNPKKKNRKTIEFNGNEIDSISSGNRELGETEVVNWNIRFYSYKNIKITTVPVIRNQFSDKEKHQADLKINTENNEENDFSNIEIVKAFQRFVALCKMK
jgi:hypothetical protein